MKGDQDWWTTGVLAFTVFILLGFYITRTSPSHQQQEVTTPLQHQE